MIKLVLLAVLLFGALSAIVPVEINTNPLLVLKVKTCGIIVCRLSALYFAVKIYAYRPP